MLYQTDKNMTNFTKSFIRPRLATLLLFLLVGVTHLFAQTLSGHVTLQGSRDPALATVRIDKLSIGSTAKLDGSYRLTGIKPGKHLVEFSFVGYKTVQQELTFAEGENKVFDVLLEEAPIMLSTVFITPDGSDPAHYIMNLVWANAERKYKANNNFQISTSTVLSFRDFDVMTELMPNSIRRVIMFVAALSGFKGVMQLIFAHPDLDVVTMGNATCKAGKYKWGEERVKTCNATLTDKEKKTLNKLTLHENFYKMIYGENLLRHKKAKLTLKGSYLDGNDVVYIIEATKGKEREVMHVIDEKWDVKKYVVTSHDNTIIVEMRKAIGGLYMPVSINTKMVMMKETPEEIEKQLSDEKEPNRKEKRMEEKMKKRLAKDEEHLKRVKKMMERIKDQGMEIAINFGMTLNYSR